VVIVIDDFTEQHTEELARKINAVVKDTAPSRRN
jgi:hypothetical protein